MEAWDSQEEDELAASGQLASVSGAMNDDADSSDTLDWLSDEYNDVDTDDAFEISGV